MGRAKQIWYLSPMRAAKVQASLRIRAVSPEPSLLAHTSRESRGTFRQKARSLAPLNCWACAVEICHDGMLEDTNSLDGAQINCDSKHGKKTLSSANILIEFTPTPFQYDFFSGFIRRNGFWFNLTWCNTIWLSYYLHQLRHEKMCLRESSTMQDANWPAQLQRPARFLKFPIYKTRGIILSWQRTTKALIRLRGCAGWSAPLLFAYGIRHIFSWPSSHVFLYTSITDLYACLSFLEDHLYCYMSRKWNLFKSEGCDTVLI